MIAIGTRLTDFTTGSQSLFQHPDVRFLVDQRLRQGRDQARRRGRSSRTRARRSPRSPPQRGTPASAPTSSTSTRSPRRAGDGASSSRRETFVQTPGMRLRQAAVHRARQPPGAARRRDHRRRRERARRPAPDVGCDRRAPRAPRVRLLVHGLRAPCRRSACGCRERRGEVYVMIGDGTFLMSPSELATAVQEGLKVTVLSRWTTTATRSSAGCSWRRWERATASSSGTAAVRRRSGTASTWSSTSRSSPRAWARAPGMSRPRPSWSWRSRRHGPRRARA